MAPYLCFINLEGLNGNEQYVSIIKILHQFRRRRLFCRNGVYLRVTADKRVAGTTNPFDPTGIEKIIYKGATNYFYCKIEIYLLNDMML